MMTGFLRQRPRRDRRAGLPVDGRLRHLRRRAPEIARMAVGYGRELAVAQRLWREAGGEERGWFDFLASVFARQARETGSLRPTN